MRRRSTATKLGEHWRVCARVGWGVAVGVHRSSRMSVRHSDMIPYLTAQHSTAQHSVRCRCGFRFVEQSIRSGSALPVPLSRSRTVAVQARAAAHAKHYSRRGVLGCAWCMLHRGRCALRVCHSQAAVAHTWHAKIADDVGHTAVRECAKWERPTQERLKWEYM